jgi:hypothetical protein
MSEELKELKAENKRLRQLLGRIACNSLVKVLRLPGKSRNNNNLYFQIAGNAIKALAGYEEHEKEKGGKDE